MQQTVTLVLVEDAGRVVDTITGTTEHPFFTADGRPVPMAAMGIGTAIVTRAGPLRVAAVRRERVPAGVRVYNLEVEGDHTYFAGGAGAWVHNVGACPVGKGVLADVMADAPYRPGQFSASASKIDLYETRMRSGKWDWGNMDEPILVDGNGVITSGHNRLVAARRAGVDVPAEAIERGREYVGPAISWGDVWVLK